MVLPRVNWMIRVAKTVRALGPYGVIELVVPGGSLIVLSVWAIRNRSWLAERVQRAFARRRANSRRNSAKVTDAKAVSPLRS